MLVGSHDRDVSFSNTSVSPSCVASNSKDLLKSESAIYLEHLAWDSSLVGTICHDTWLCVKSRRTVLHDGIPSPSKVRTASHKCRRLCKQPLRLARQGRAFTRRRRARAEGAPPPPHSLIRRARYLSQRGRAHGWGAGWVPRAWPALTRISPHP